MNPHIPPRSPSPRLRHRTMTAACFVCNLPILSHQVGLTWTGGNGWDEVMRSAQEDATVRARLGSLRETAAQAFCRSPPQENNAEPKGGTPRRRRSSLAHLTDLFREWSSNAASKRNKKKIDRRETVADLARSMPRTHNDNTSKSRRRESSAESGLISFLTKRRGSKPATPPTESRFDFWSYFTRSNKKDKKKKKNSRASEEENEPRRESLDEILQRLRQAAAAQARVETQRKRQKSRKTSFADASVEANEACPAPTVTFLMTPTCRNAESQPSSSDMQTIITAEVTPTPTLHTAPNAECKPSTSGMQTIITAEVTPTPTSPTAPNAECKPSSSGMQTMITAEVTAMPASPNAECKPSSSGMPTIKASAVTPTPASPNAECQLPSSGMPTIITSAVTSSPTSPTAPNAVCKPSSSGMPTKSPAAPKAQIPTEATGAIRKTTNVSARRDSTTQCGKSRRNSRAGVSPERRMKRLQRQATAYEDSGPSGARRRDSGGSTLGPDEVRRDSLSPDSAARPRREPLQFSPDRAGGSELSPAAAKRKKRLRRQDTRARGRRPRSPDSSSCSSREPSPCARPAPPVIRRQSVTEEIMIARGFRRQSTTEEMIRCRNLRRHSCQSDDACTRSKGRRDSSTQIVDGTVNTMTVETATTFFDTSTQTEPAPEYDNSHYHEECLKCNSCGMNLTGHNQKRARRYKNQILCDLHFADVSLMESSDFMQQLRSFKPHSLGCAVARRKSSTALIFPLPPQACSDEFCEEHPHNVVVTSGYWIECSRQKITSDTIWDESETEHEDDPPGASNYRDHRYGYVAGSLDEVEEGNEAAGPSTSSGSNRKKTPIEEEWERVGHFELTSVEQETYEKYFYGKEHWNYFSTDDDLGPVIMSLKQDVLNSRDQFRILLRAISYTVHGLIPASCVFADRYNREEVVKSLGKEINIIPPLILGTLSGTPEELLKLDQVFIKSELKVGIMYVSEGQLTEEQILNNNENTPMFDEFLDLLGELVRLRGFEQYKGGLDTTHDLTGLYSVYTLWRGIEVMFHVSTLLPYERHDPQKLQRKRHIGNDIVCLVFLEADNTSFSPACIKSHFLHTFIIIRVSAKIKRRPTRYEISIVSRDEVGAYKPYLWEQSVFDIGPMFREWLFTKIVNGERASYSAPKFARMQERTRSQMLEDLVANLHNHAETGQMPKPYRRGSWRPIGHMRPSSPLLDSVRNLFEDYDALSRDFSKAFINKGGAMPKKRYFFDVTFLVGQGKVKTKMRAVRAILGVRSRVFQEMLYGIQMGVGSPQDPVADILSKPAPSLVAETSKRRQKTSNFLQVPDMESRTKSVPNSPMVKRAFSRLTTITAGWGRSLRKQALGSDDRKKGASSQDCNRKNKEAKQKNKKNEKNKAGASGVPRLSVCADQQKVDKSKLEQSEFTIIEFEPEPFGILLEYLHTGTCRLSCLTIPGLICAAEHFDIPELLQACFHHAKQYMKTEVVCAMLIQLENYYWRYTSALELLNMTLAFVDQRAFAIFQLGDFYDLSESMVQSIMCRNLDVPEIQKFEAMLSWAKYKVKYNTHPKLDSDYEFKCIMNRMSKDLKLNKITPQELIKVVLPTKTIRNDKILETLTHQASSGVYQINQNHIQAVQNPETTTTRTRPAEMESIELCI